MFERAVRASIVPLVAALGICGAARAQEPSVELVVAAGRPLRVSLDDTVTVKRVGQTIAGTVVEPVYAYDLIVIPAGARVTGRIAAMPQPSKASRARAMLSGDFSPRTGRFSTSRSRATSTYSKPGSPGSTRSAARRSATPSPPRTPI